VLKALKKIFGKSPTELSVAQPASDAPSEAAPNYSEPRETQAPQHSDTPAVTKPRRERTRKPAAPPPPAWKLEDFVVEPAEGKTRFHDFKLSPELMHAIQDLGFPYCTPIQAQVLGFTLKGRDAIGRARQAPAKPPRS